MVNLLVSFIGKGQKEIWVNVNTEEYNNYIDALIATLNKTDTKLININNDCMYKKDCVKVLVNSNTLTHVLSTEINQLPDGKFKVMNYAKKEIKEVEK